MGRRTPILGILGLIFILFGALEHWMTYDPRAEYLGLGWYSALHLLCGVGSLIWYFSAGSGSIGTFVKARSTRYGLNAAVYSVLFVLALAMVNFMGARYHKRFDVSSSGVNSLSEQSKQVLAHLDQDVEILSFVEPGDAAFLREIVKIYGYHSDRVRFRIIDPQVNPELAQRESISHVPALKVKMGDRSTIVRDLDEEAITNGINRVAVPDQKTIYFAEGHGEASIEDSESPGGMGLFVSELRGQNYEVSSVFLGETGAVPDDAAALVVSAADRDYFPAELDMISGYMKSGGRLLFLLEPTKGKPMQALLQSCGVSRICGCKWILQLFMP